ncbi:McrC family protein [Bradyrhizobium sp. 10BB]|nr:McrC family protein [Bradyrhizobium acaciae]
MKESIVVREHARLTTDELAVRSLDCERVSSSAFEWLCRLMSLFRNSGASLAHLENRRCLRLDNYVGVLETPCGTRLEILPKHFELSDDVNKSRQLLRRMILSALDLPVREIGPADLQLFDAPLNEWVIQQFLLALDHLVKRGVRFDYRRVEEEKIYLRGQLDLGKQLRQPPGRRHHFQIRHDIFLADIPENRLLKLALEIACKTTQESRNWHLGHELRNLLHEIPASSNVWSDFEQWRDDRLLARYQQIRPWCELILRQQTPMALAHEWRGISLLFPMEKLFERYVGSILRRALLKEASLKAHAASQHLCEHDGGKVFRLEPDFLVTHGKKRWVLDAKWKLIDAGNKRDSYDLRQSDFYQLFAYGHKYLGGQSEGELVLIYPKRPQFMRPLPPFDFSSQLRLWVLPIDLEHSCIEGIQTTNVPVAGGLKAYGTRAPDQRVRTR